MANKTKPELERENYLLRQEVARLQKYYDKWAPFIGALQNVVQGVVEDSIPLYDDD